MPNAGRRLKNANKAVLRRVFEAGQRLGFDLLPRHFYSEIPSIRALRESKAWRAPYSMHGVAGLDLDDQVAFLRECCPPPIVEAMGSKAIHTEAAAKNGEAGFGPVEADFLYAFVASHRPQQILQIGCGVSTAVCLLAAEDAGYSPEVLCIEPYPTDYLIQEADAGRITLLREPAQCVDLGRVDALAPDVFFFVDSTHTLGPAGEVSRIVLEMLPRLKPGAWVHFHDIKFPYDYDRQILGSTLFFPHESVLLHAFLAYNCRFRIMASLSFLHYACPRVLAQYLPHYRPAGNDDGMNHGEGHFPSSTYLRALSPAESGAGGVALVCDKGGKL